MLGAAVSGLAKNTCRVYTAHLTDFLLYLDLNDSALSRLSVEQYLTSKKFALSSHNQALSAIKCLSEQAARHNWISFQTALSIASIRTMVQRGTKAGNWLTLDQVKALLAAPGTSLPGKRDKAVFALLIGCGLRREELAHLTWDQIGMRDGRTMLIDVRGKGNRLRSIGVPEWANKILNAWSLALVERDPIVANDRVVRSIKQNGTIHGSLSPTGIWTIVLEYAAQLNLTFTPHDLRRTYAKLARKGNAPLEVIQKSLGHSSIKTTELYVNSGEEANAGDYLKL